MNWAKDTSGRFLRRPYYSSQEMEAQCEALILDHLTKRHGATQFPVTTDDLLSTNVSLRLDGRPRSDSEPSDPGVALYFSFKGKATVFACDRFDRVADNIAAIAAHVDALRRVERYGVGTIEQALAGYKALPADTAANWRAVFGFRADTTPTLEQLDAAYKTAARTHHPDRGGTDEGMAHVNRAHDYALQELAS